MHDVQRIFTVITHKRARVVEKTNPKKFLSVRAVPFVVAERRRVDHAQTIMTLVRASHTAPINSNHDTQLEAHPH